MKFLDKKERRRSSLQKGSVGDSLDLAKNPKIASLFAKHGNLWPWGSLTALGDVHLLCQEMRMSFSLGW